MRPRLTPFSYDGELFDGKEFQGDRFNRKPAVTLIAKLLEEYESPSVIGVNAPWGHGKTTFLRFLEAYLNHESRNVAYFNAWESDFLDDPLLSIAKSIESAIQNTELQKAWKEKLKHSAGRICLSAGKVALKAASAGLIQTDDMKDVAKTLQGEVGGLIDEFAKDYVEAYENARNSLDALKNELERIVAASPNGRFVILVDELDRCRPTYALQCLEKIKHVFEVEGLMFVIATDRTALSSVVNAVYGANYDANGYLRRFIDVELQLPLPNLEEFCLYILQPSQRFFPNSSGLTAGAVRLEHYAAELAAIGRAFGFGLRELKAVATALPLVLLSMGAVNHVSAGYRSGIVSSVQFMIAAEIRDPGTIARCRLSPSLWYEQAVTIEGHKHPNHSGLVKSLEALLVLKDDPSHHLTSVTPSTVRDHIYDAIKLFNPLVDDDESLRFTTKLFPEPAPPRRSPSD